MATTRRASTTATVGSPARSVAKARQATRSREQRKSPLQNQRESEMKKLLLAATICIAIAPVTASAQSWGRGGAYTGASPSAAYYPRSQANSRGDGSGCDSLCQSKCQASWRALGFQSVNACVARWAKLNAEGTAATCETAIKANGMRPVRGC